MYSAWILISTNKLTNPYSDSNSRLFYVCLTLDSVAAQYLSADSSLKMQNNEFEKAVKTAGRLIWREWPYLAQVLSAVLTAFSNSMFYNIHIFKWEFSRRNTPSSICNKVGYKDPAPRTFHSILSPSLFFEYLLH